MKRRSKQLENAVRDYLDVKKLRYFRVQIYRCPKCHTVFNSEAKDFPDLDKLNKEFSLWRSVEEIANSTTLRKTGQQNTLSKTLPYLIGGGAGFSEGEGIEGRLTGAVVGAAVFGQLSKIVQSPAWRTVSATQKNKLAKAILEGNGETARTLIRNIGSLIQ